eukprot:scaffold491570_cov45-Prasinocladus_malaysianus.AAC.1
MAVAASIASSDAMSIPYCCRQEINSLDDLPHKTTIHPLTDDASRLVIAEICRSAAIISERRLESIPAVVMCATQHYICSSSSYGYMWAVNIFPKRAVSSSSAAKHSAPPCL